MELVLEKSTKDKQSCRLARVSLCDLHANVCSPPDTPLALMRMTRALLFLSLVKHCSRNANTILQIFHRPAVIRPGSHRGHHQKGKDLDAGHSGGLKLRAAP
jgi:hypothetical protein